jgi:hypothetical protein
MLQDIAEAEQPTTSLDRPENSPGDTGRPTKKAKKAKRELKASTGAKASTSEADPKVQKLKRICQQAGIPIGPGIYKQEDRVAAFTALLQKHGLSAKSSTAPSVTAPVHLLVADCTCC